MSALAGLASRLKFGAVGAGLEVRCGDSICSGTKYLQRNKVSATEQSICNEKTYQWRNNVSAAENRVSGKNLRYLKS